MSAGVIMDNSGQLRIFSGDMSPEPLRDGCEIGLKSLGDDDFD